MVLHARGWLRRVAARVRPGSRTRAAHLRLGSLGERAAVRHLRRTGHRILARNLETPGGECDIVCLDRAGGEAVLVEVKTRMRDTAEPGIPATAAINADKRRRLVRSAQALVSHPRLAGRRIRIDVISVEYRHPGDRCPEIRHFRNAVGGDGRLR